MNTRIHRLWMMAWCSIGLQQYFRVDAGISAQIKRYRIAICDAFFVICNTNEILLSNICDTHYLFKGFSNSNVHVTYMHCGVCVTTGLYIVVTYHAHNLNLLLVRITIITVVTCNALSDCYTKLTFS